MHSYTRNSPEAAARLVALALIADGHVCRRELDAVTHAQTEEKLCLPPGSLDQALLTLCEDLSFGTRSGGSVFSGIDEAMLQAMISEIDDVELQCQIVFAVVDAVHADGHVADAEMQVLRRYLQQWELASLLDDVPQTLPPDTVRPLQRHSAGMAL